jgi:thiamine-phosphate pyrophosphorylase
MQNQNQLYRILDANFNRLREALRVVEEFFRFVAEDESACVELKRMRHALTGMEAAVGQGALLENRDTANDCLASESRPEEMDRANAAGVLNANFKRAQEACRVIEEYAKAVGTEGAGQASRSAKETRFLLYDMQKRAASQVHQNRS